MEKQIVPQGDSGCASPCENDNVCASLALVPVGMPKVMPPVSDGLKARIEQAAGECGLPAPVILPGACLTLIPVDLPLKTARLRRKALPFAIEDQISGAIDQMVLSVGPGLGANRYLGAVCSSAFLQPLIPPQGAQGVALPDLLGVPTPETGWHVWSDGHTAYVRCHDGGGLVCRTDALPVLWQAAGRPNVASLTGKLPHGPEALDLSDNPPGVTTDDLRLDLRTGRMRARRHRWQALARFAAVTVLVAGLGHLALLAWDARTLLALATARVDQVAVQLAGHTPGLTLDLPLRVIADRLFPTSDQFQQDTFMSLLADVSAAFSGSSNPISFREMRFGARDGVLTLLVQGRGLESLQAAELALSDAGLTVTSGAATATDGGAEVFMQISRGAG